MTKPVDPLQILGEVLALFGGARKFLLTMVMLVMFFVAVFLPIPAAYELWRVGEVEQWREVPVRLDAVERKRPTFGKGPSIWRYSFTDPELGKVYETGDIEPGDIPFTVAGWATTDAMTRSYRAQVGQTIRVSRSPDGQRYFLRRRTMAITLGLCGAYWLWLLAVLAKRRKGKA